MMTMHINNNVAIYDKIRCKKQMFPCMEPNIVSRLYQEILRVFSTWNGLQIAIQHKWGGHDTTAKYEDFVIDILTLLSQSKGSYSVDDLENLLHEGMLFSFNTDIEDGSIEEVAEQLQIMHEGCLHGIHP
ncbi:uncharacterized protein LOC141642324 [Silene latifolia]|uniref:uncharacterized protein LOC141642324 n=1 Tax=Silene latifolia TaxID=37657 RepID=UPI003D76B0F9